MRSRPTSSRDSPGRRAPRGWWLGLVGAACLAGAAPARALPATGGPCRAGACVLAPPAHPFAYVTGLDGGVSQFAAGPGGLTALSPGTVGGGIPSAVAVAPDGTTVYVASLSDDPVIIAQLIGLLQPAVQTVRGPGGGSGFTHQPAASIRQFDVNTDGTLTPKSPAGVTAGEGPSAIVVTPDGNCVFVTNFRDGTVSQYHAGPGGALTQSTPALVVAGTRPLGIAVSPNGKSVYVTNNADGTVSQYDVGTGGTLTPKTPATVQTGNGPIGIAVTPDGKSVFVTNALDDTVSQYAVGPRGELIAKTPFAVPAGIYPDRIALTPDGQSAYITNANDDTVSQYDVGIGWLSPKTPATVATGDAPDGIAVTPDGNSVYVAIDNGRTPTQNTVAQYGLGAGGALIPKTPASVWGSPRADAVAVGPAQLVYHCAGVLIACTAHIELAGDAAHITATLARAAPVGIRVERIAGKRRLHVGRVPFGPHRTGRLQIRWNLRINGHKLPKGRYLITLRVFDHHQHLIALAHPVQITVPGKTTIQTPPLTHTAAPGRAGPAAELPAAGKRARGRPRTRSA